MNIIVAYSENRVIGNLGKIPWYLPEDLKNFKRLTMGKTVIMGRKTWESLPNKPLKGRQNVVMTSTTLPDVECAISVESAVKLARNEIWVIGGAQIYKAFLDAGLITSIIATEVRGNFSGDTFFPILHWKEVSREDFERYSVVKYIKV